jgi:hypothetical protein
MIRTSIRLAAIALLTAVGMLVAPVAASALTTSGASISVNAPSAGGVEGDVTATTMCGPDVAAMAAAMQKHPEIAKMMAKMMKAHHPGMAAKMKGHASMAAAMRAHPEMAKKMPAMMREMMKADPRMAAAMRAHPKMAKMVKADCDA